jgi:hypothetical protein
MKLSRLKVLLTVGAALMLTACATVGPPQPPSLELPKPPSDLRAMRKGDRVTLTWTVPTVTTDRQRVHSLGSIRICRGLEAELTKCGTPVGKAPPSSGAPNQGATNPSVTNFGAKKSSKPKIEESYTDSLPAQIESDDRSAFVTYAIEVLNADGRGAGLSNPVRVPLVRTLLPPRDFTAHVTSQGIVLTWTNALPAAASMPEAHYVDRVYRRTEGSLLLTLIGELRAGREPNSTLTDSNIEWEKTYHYHAETVTEIAQENKPPLEVEGDDSPEIAVFAHDIFPPSVPSGLQAVFSGPGQQPFIDLIWAPVTDVDLGGYNVYRHEAGIDPVALNSEPLKAPSYRDAVVISGKKYFYSVSAVDVRGNESERSDETSERVP